MLSSVGATPPTRSLPILSKQPAFCAKQLGTNYFWLAQADMACLGFPATGCGGATPCGWISINGQRLNITDAHADEKQSDTIPPSDDGSNSAGSQTAYAGAESGSNNRSPNSSAQFFTRGRVAREIESLGGRGVRGKEDASRP